MKKDSKQWILTAFLVGTSTAAIALPAASPFCGFYFGGSAGGAFFSAREGRTGFVAVDYNGLGPTPPPTPTPPTPPTPPAPPPPVPNAFDASASHSVQHAYKKNSFDVAIYTGYGYTWEDAYLGVEAFLHNTHYDAKGKHAFSASSESVLGQAALNANVSNITSISTRLSRIEPGIDVRPGIFLTPFTLLYGRLGVGYNKLTLHADTHPSALFSYTPTGTATGDDRETNSRRKKMGALRLGIGLEQNICENIYIRADYINTHYRGTKLRTLPESYTATTPNGDILTYTASTTSRVTSFFNNTVTLGMSYYW
jgi:opacity protein-like surface antigen